MEPKDLQLTNSSKIPHYAPATEDYSSVRRGIYAFTMVIQVVTCILGVSGNGLVIWATGFKLKRTSYTVWLLSLAVADFTFSLLLPLSITDLALDNEWPFGRLLCKLHFGVQVLCLYASVWTLVAISVDRCISVVLPIWSRTHRSPRLATLLTLGVWVVAALQSVPTFTFRQLVFLGKRTWCSGLFLLEGEWAVMERAAQNTTGYGDKEYLAMLEWVLSRHDSRFQALSLAGFLLGFLLPFLVITTSYAIIVLQLKWGRLTPSSGNSFKFIAAIILAFLLCWAPYHMVSILELIHQRGRQLPLALKVCFQLSSKLVYFNTCINPVLYIFTWQDFRDLLKKSLQWDDNQEESMQTQL
uniref:chemerin-like receptor 1 n=1 Tax=Pristiophorus japonicus TaxID=55135 RepID=UPI00398F4C19